MYEWRAPSYLTLLDHSSYCNYYRQCSQDQDPVWCHLPGNYQGSRPDKVQIIIRVMKVLLTLMLTQQMLLTLPLREEKLWLMDLRSWLSSSNTWEPESVSRPIENCLIVDDGVRSRIRRITRQLLYSSLLTSGVSPPSWCSPSPLSLQLQDSEKVIIRLSFSDNYNSTAESLRCRVKGVSR